MSGLPIPAVALDVCCGVIDDLTAGRWTARRPQVTKVRRGRPCDLAGERTDRRRAGGWGSSGIGMDAEEPLRASSSPFERQLWRTCGPALYCWLG